MRPIFLIVVCLALLASCGPMMLKQAPAPGKLRYNEVVLVDDGSCAPGQVSRQTGGNNKLNIPRKVECVPRP